MQQDDFFYNANIPKNAPLASRMAPKTFEEFMGQENIVGQNKLLRRAIEADNLGSVVFFGPPGSGKSALARIIASKTKSYFEQANAVTIGIADIRKILESAKNRLQLSAKKTILMLDEIHHFNRSQQDALLPDVERGIISLIGITTENPFFYINAAILSRTLVFEFMPLSQDALDKILNNALTDKQNGLGAYEVEMTEEAREHLIKNSDGDARKLLNALEIGILSTAPNENGVRVFDLSVACESLSKRAVVYDRSGDAHYDHISAFIKSMRGSDPDAAIYWMAKMLTAGEDPRFIARRIIICASEDVGIADPRALTLAVSALDAVNFVGMPEAKIILAQSAIYVAIAPKSNSAYLAISAAMNEVKNGLPRSVPNHLKDATLDSKTLGHGQGYKYAHDYPNHYVKQDYGAKFGEFYKPSKEGYEGKINQRLQALRQEKNEK
ncbi:MAG: replication-associated recombination protein A [Elusimicrobiota bacterium]|jgi:putative ATPase|nr:replication-associated recombination protein A [Elusimicrobiota bacterium]